MMPRKTVILLVVIGFLLFILLIVGGIVGYLFYKHNKDNDKGEDNDTDVTTFQECLDAGFPVQETYPRRCVADNGETFTEDISTNGTTGSDEGTTSDTHEETPTTTTVKVYFSKNPNSMDDPTYVVGVNRTTTRVDVATFGIEQLIAGPTSSEKSASHLFTPLELSGSSNCSGKDFTVTINKTTKVATIKFCKTIQSAGGMADGRITTAVEKTINQFSSVDSVIILNKDGHCFGDESGMDICLD